MLSAGGAVSSGIDLSILLQSQFYVAFKYTAVSGGIQNKWTITARRKQYVVYSGYQLSHPQRPKRPTIRYYYQLRGSLQSVGFLTKLEQLCVNCGCDYFINVGCSNGGNCHLRCWSPQRINGANRSEKSDADSDWFPIKAIIDNMNKFHYSYRYRQAERYRAILLVWTRTGIVWILSSEYYLLQWNSCVCFIIPIHKCQGHWPLLNTL